jgi:hypothetical protein
MGGLVMAALGLVLGVGGLLLILAAIGRVTLPVRVMDQAEVLAGATLILVAVGIFAWLANAALASATRQLARQGEAERLLRRAHLDVIFDPAQPALWWEERQWVRVMATNDGPAIAANVVVTLEKIEPANQNPMLAVKNGNRKGINVLPSLLDRKGLTTQQREHPFRCYINPQSREYFDVLVYHLADTTGFPEVAFHIAEKDALAYQLGIQGVDNVWCPLVWEVEYALHVRATAANADPVEHVFKFKATRAAPWFRFWSTSGK